MNNILSKGVCGMFVVLSLAACADDNFADYQTEKPQNKAEYEYLNAL